MSNVCWELGSVVRGFAREGPSKIRGLENRPFVIRRIWVVLGKICYSHIYFVPVIKVLLIKSCHFLISVIIFEFTYSCWAFRNSRLNNLKGIRGLTFTDWIELFIRAYLAFCHSKIWNRERSVGSFEHKYMFLVKEFQHLLINLKFFIILSYGNIINRT